MRCTACIAAAGAAAKGAGDRLRCVARERILSKRVLQGAPLIHAWLGNWSVLEMQQQRQQQQQGHERHVEQTDRVLL